MRLNTLLASGTALLSLSTPASAMPTAQASDAHKSAEELMASTPRSDGAIDSTAVPNTTPGTGHVDLGEPVPPPHQLEEEADRYLFNITLEEFIGLRDQRYPSYFFWESDGCSQSPDHPFGFPFLPACYRHDFGYDQYKKEGRFTPANKEKLDRNFRSDLYHICSAPDLAVDVCVACAEDPHRKDIDCKHRTDMCKFPAGDICRCLGDIYYTAVKKFGRKEKRIRKWRFNKGGMGGFKIPISKMEFPSFDVTSLALCLNKNIHSKDGRPVD